MIAARHAGALGTLLLLAVLQTWPLAARLGTHLPGLHVGDNVAFAWNLWWMREAWASPGVTFFHTDYLFAPIGTSLVLHTHSALLGAGGASLGAALSPVAALGVAIIACVFLNGAAAYGLAWHVTRSSPAALLAGVIFSLSPVLAVRLMGHFNLICVWTLVLTVWLGLRALESGRTGTAVAAGLGLGLTAWTDYYLLVYAATILGVVLVWRNVTAQVTAERRARRWPGRVLLGLLAVSFLGAVAILVTGGTVMTRLPLPVSMRSPMNLMTASWVLLALSAVTTWRVRVRFAPGLQDRTRRDMQVAACALVACLVVIAPLVSHAWDLWRAGDYVEPPRFWRSAPLGADPATLVLGPPMHGLVGPAVRARYEHLGIDFMECAAWFGMTASILALLALRVPATSLDRPWRVIGGVFLVWALGPFLTIAGVNTGLLLPQQFVRYVPILANARIPGRGLIVVSLAMAVLVACWAASRRSRLVYLLAIVVAAEQVAAPLPLVATDVPAVYSVLATRPAGNVLELPFGFHDGFGMRGVFDEARLLYQTVHRHPMTGGSVSRLSPRIEAFYRDTPLFAALLRASAGEAAAEPLGCEAALRDLRAAGVRYVVTDDTMPAALRDAVQRWPLLRVAGDERRTLSEVGDRCGSPTDLDEAGARETNGPKED
jgi:hypothetical protein